MKALAARRNNRTVRRQSAAVTRRSVMAGAFEQLESRRMMSLLGVTPSYPLILVQNSASQGINYTYNSSSSNGFLAVSTPVQIQFDSATFPDSISNGTLTINFNVDANGNVLPGQTGPNLILTGTATNLFTGQVDYSGVLLEGNISRFGYASSPPTANFDFDFTIGANDSGALMPLFDGYDIGVSILSLGSTFTGNFTSSFTGGVNGQIGTIPSTGGGSPSPVVLSGTKFQDLTGDGFSPDDTALAGVTINLFQDADNDGLLTAADGAPIASKITNPDGSYLFDNLLAGPTYFVQEAADPSYVQTDGPSYYTASPAAGQAVANLNFDNFQKITISGTKFQDLTGNSFSADDTPLANITINLYNASDLSTPIASTLTGTDGSYSFADLGPGTYFVQEVLPAGYTQTGGNAGYTIPATSGLVSSNNNFDNYALQPQIDIEKYVNPAPTSLGGEGLTPGFWKQSQHFYAWTAPYVPTGPGASSYDAVFGLTPSQDDPSLSLLGALGRGGGGKAALGRHAAAALLNAANPNVSYLYSTAQIIALVQNAYATGDYETAKNLLAAQNELEADLSTPAVFTPSAPAPGYDADLPGSGPTVLPGTQLTFTFVVTNPGQTPLMNVVVTDDNATPGDTSDDFNPTYVSGDTNHDSILDLNETWVYTYVTSALAGSHTNTATVTGTNVFNSAQQVTDADAANYDTGSTPAPATLSGTKFLDVTGNGFSPDDTGLGGVTINLYADNDNSNTYTSGDTLYASTVTAPDGSYSFDNLPAGKYLVREVLTSDYVRTGPALSDTYAVTVAPGDLKTGYDFANAEKCDLSDFCNVYYIINGHTKVYDLRGNTHQGDTVTAYFKYNGSEANHPVTLVSYYAPTSYFDANNASLQTIYQQQTVYAQPGHSYSVAVVIPDCYYQVDFVCGYAIDTFGPANSNIFYTPQNRLISADNGGTSACFCGTGSISGLVYNDKNDNGDVDGNEAGIAGVLVHLTGTNDLGQTVDAWDTTDANGSYLFTGLRDGTYKVTESQPSSWLDGKDTVGTLGGNTSNDLFSNITISGGADGLNYNFGELAKPGVTLSADMTATIGFWQNKNGQCLIESMNGSKYSPKLGNWLAANFPNLFGNTPGAACNLAGKSNAQVADAFTQLFKVRGTKVEAQVMATALAVYVTDSSLAGGTYAARYGFTVNSNGTGDALFNVGSYGSAIGLNNYQSYSISTILAAANHVDAFDRNSSTQTAINNLFTSINETGDI